MFRRLTTAVAFFDFKQEREEQHTYTHQDEDLIFFDCQLDESSPSRARFFPLHWLDQSELDVCVSME